MAVDVLADAQVDYRDYWIDPYLKDVLVVNPMPVVAHKEALQLIANAGRCILYQDRTGRIILKSSFVPDMEAASDNETYFSHASAILDHAEKEAYACLVRITQAHPAHSISFPGRRPMEPHISIRAMCLRPSRGRRAVYGQSHSGNNYGGGIQVFWTNPGIWSQLAGYSYLPCLLQ